jgi:hypothetical protein
VLVIFWHRDREVQMGDSTLAAAGGDSLLTKPSSRLAAARRIWDEHVQKGETPYICSSEGFYQHTGECANDSIQMVLCFCDHFKEIVQETLIKGDLSKAGKHTSYVAAFQRRFVRHYLNEHANTGKYRASGANALTAAIAAKYGLDQVSVCEYVEKKMWGMTYTTIQSWFASMMTIFDLNSTIEPITMINRVDISLPIWSIVTDNTVGFLIGAFKQGSPMEAHAMAYYKCGGIEYFYDDNYGPVPFAWTAFFDEIRKAIDDAATPIHIRIHHVSMRFEVQLSSTNSRVGAHPFYPVFEVCSSDKDMKKGIYYTLFPYGREVKTLAYTAKFDRYMNDIEDKDYIWFNQTLNNMKHFGIFTVDMLMPLRYRFASTSVVESVKHIVAQPQVAVSRTGQRYNVYNPPITQSVSTSNAAGVLPDYESESDDDGLNNQKKKKRIDGEDILEQGKQKQLRTQGGGKRKTRKHQRKAKRHTKHHRKHRHH